MISEKMNAALNEQVTKEMYSAYLYMSMSSFLPAVHEPAYAMSIRTRSPSSSSMKTPLPGSLGSVIGNYKMLVTKRVKALRRATGGDMQVWQRGFKYTLTNGYTLSCAFGYGNYCGNRHDRSADLGNKDGYKVESSDFEVAVFEPNGDMVDLFPAEEPDGWADQVIAYVPASALTALIMALKFWPVRENFKNEPDTFKQMLHARCHMFRGICKDFMDKADKEAANVQA